MTFEERDGPEEGRMEETTDALGLMEGREEEWRQESEEGRSTRQKSDGRKGGKREGQGGRKRS